jgi:F0F1-type ATP synthase assembly protein I
MSDPKSAWQLPPGMMRLAGAGVELAAGIGGACLLGWWIDRHFETAPWGVLICAIVGVVGSLYNMIRRSVHEMLRESAARKDKSRVPPKQTPPP